MYGAPAADFYGGKFYFPEERSGEGGGGGGTAPPVGLVFGRAEKFTIDFWPGALTKYQRGGILYSSVSTRFS